MSFNQELAWVYRHTPKLRRALAVLPTLEGVRLACNMHLDLKMVPLVEGLLARGVEVFLTTCNPTTVRDDVVAYLTALGAKSMAWRDMPPNAYQEAIEQTLAWEPTHLCEVGAELTVAYHQQTVGAPPIYASLEATGSGIDQLNNITSRYPIFNWDDLPVKEGLHNRYMVGLTTWHTFFERTHLTLHEKRVLVIGYGLVGQGLAAAARAYGGAVSVVERDPVRALEAAYAGWDVRLLDEALPQADVVVTATGRRGVLNSVHWPLLRDGAFLLNVGHLADEIDTISLRRYPTSTVLPFVEAINVDGRTLYLFAGGSMANLTAGYGDSLNAFDLPLAVMTAGIGYILGAGASEPPGIHLLPRSVWEPFVG